ncbi:hypothetical protein [Clostridium ganghwense]|uniref:Lipoprotein n=1 Tax=Clostridium ganghwense TaxID=312089 RepID=A0ABT4CQJ1_9CLOT|nr:hypothetical protein [Clostridium ganghwense]MCY6371304.1 hypothetical protein [Clostridium ganghwense]
MKSIIKKISCFACVSVLTAVIVGCGAKGKAEVAKNKDAAKTAKVYSEELAKYFPALEGTVLKYSGTAEYGHTITLNKVTDNQESLTLDFKGEIQDVSEGEGPSKEDLLLETQYVVDKDSVKEIQKNVKRRHSQSIIREQVVLKLPIEKGKTWSQKVSIDGKEYTAETKIVEVSTDDKNKNIVKTETVVKGIESYPENTYKEIKIFKEGKGLVEFQNVILLQKEPFEFRYKLFEPQENK